MKACPNEAADSWLSVVCANFHCHEIKITETLDVCESIVKSRSECIGCVIDNRLCRV